jgi:hypothetical protein
MPDLLEPTIIQANGKCQRQQNSPLGSGRLECAVVELIAEEVRYGPRAVCTEGVATITTPFLPRPCWHVTVSWGCG